MTGLRVIARSKEDSFASLGAGYAISKKPVIANAVKQSQCVAPRMRLPRSIWKFAMTIEEAFLLHEF